MQYDTAAPFPAHRDADRWLGMRQWFDHHGGDGGLVRRRGHHRQRRRKRNGRQQRGSGGSTGTGGVGTGGIVGTGGHTGSRGGGVRHRWRGRARVGRRHWHWRGRRATCGTVAATERAAAPPAARAPAPAGPAGCTSGTKTPGTPQSGDITVTPSKTYQVVDGFGEADVWQGSSSTAMQTLLWDPVNGIGLNLLRVGIDGTSGSPNIMGAAGYADGTACVKFNGSACKVWAAPWSPPARMKGQQQRQQRRAPEHGQLRRVGQGAGGVSGVLQEPRRRGPLRHLGAERA